MRRTIKIWKNLVKEEVIKMEKNWSIEWKEIHLFQPEENLSK